MPWHSFFSPLYNTPVLFYKEAVWWFQSSQVFSLTGFDLNRSAIPTEWSVKTINFCFHTKIWDSRQSAAYQAHWTWQPRWGTWCRVWWQRTGGGQSEADVPVPKHKKPRSKRQGLPRVGWFYPTATDETITSMKTIAIGLCSMFERLEETSQSCIIYAKSNSNRERKSKPNPPFFVLKIQLWAVTKLIWTFSNYFVD